MCGILACFGNQRVEEYKHAFPSLQHRGPDNTSSCVVDNVFMGFHRLGINDLSEEGNQPMYLNGVHMICNGEIYNFKALIEQYGFVMKSQSDCEVILHLYHRFLENHENNHEAALHALCNALDGEFAFCLYDSDKKRLFVARDPYGVRPLFVGYDAKCGVYISSELKGFSKDDIVVAHQFAPGTFDIFQIDQDMALLCKEYKYRAYDHMERPMQGAADFQAALKTINLNLRAAVNKRVSNSDRKVCALLSGGLDSSLVAAIAAENFPPYTFETFSIGLKGSTDLAFSQIVADYIKSKHTIIELEPRDFLDAIEETVRVIESYDTTSVRASVGNYLVAKYIREHSDNKVVLNGDYSDEVTGGYIYLKNCTNQDEFAADCWRLVDNIHYFDSLRSDRTICSQGLEARTPFSDKAFIEHYMSLPPEWRMSYDKIEKHMLRRAFSKDKLLPADILWRRKEAFSDGVSNPEQSWHHIITEYVDRFVTDEDFATRADTYPVNTPALKETLYYRRLFDKYYSCPEVIPYYWLPRFCGDLKDPSAREIKQLY